MWFVATTRHHPHIDGESNDKTARPWAGRRARPYHRAMRFLRPVLAAALTLVLLGLGVTIDGTALAVPPSPAEQPAVVPQECGPTGPEATHEAEPTLEQLIGQKLMVPMSGRKVSAALARRVRRGEVGGVILLSRNVTTRSALGKLTRKLQRAAAQGGSAAASNRDRPGRWLGQARSLGTTDHPDSGDRSHRQLVAGPSPRSAHWESAPASRHQCRSRPGRRHPEVHGLVHASAGPDVLLQCQSNGQAG